MSITDSIFETASYTVTRPGAGSHVNGEWVPGSTSDFSIDASIQPLSARELLVLPEGRRESEIRLVLTTTEVRNKDTVAIGSETWEFFNAEEWSAFGDIWYEAFIAKQDVP